MKKTTALLFTLFTIIAGLGVVSCQQHEPITPSITVNPVTVEGEGGNIIIPFTITGDASAKPEVECNVSWLHDIKVTESVIGCKVDANPTLEERVATITLKCGDIPAVDITVTQKVANSDFVINIVGITPYSCTVNFAPIKHDGPYFYLVVNAEYFNNFKANKDFGPLYEEDLAWLEDLAEYKGVSLESYLSSNAQLYSTTAEPCYIVYQDLNPDSDYVAYCYGMDGQGVRTTDICYTEFSTTIIQSSDITFTLEVSDITTNSATIEVSPSNEDTYFWTYISEMDYAKYDDYNVMMTMINNIKNEVANGQDVFNIIHQGKSSQTPEQLWSGTEYHIIAWGIDARCNPTTQPVNIGSFNTLSAGISDNCTFEISCPEVTQTDMLINVKPSNNTTRYMICPIEESICEAYDDEQMAQRIINMEQKRFDGQEYGEGVDWTNAEWIFTGEQSVWGRADLMWTFEAGKTYRIFVFGIDHNGSRTTNVARFDQTCSEVQRSDMTFTAEVVKSAWDHPIIRVTPSNDEEYWVACLIKTEYVDWYRNADGTINEHEMMHLLDEEYFDGDTKYYAKRGMNEGSYYWSSDSEYSLVVCGWSGTNTTPFFEFKFNTPSIPWGESDASVDVVYYLFDGEELAQMDPMVWAGYNDNCIIYIEYTPNESAAHWYGGVWLPLEQYELGVDHLIPLLKNDTVSHVDQSWGRYSGCVFDYTYSFSWFAEDAEGKFGEWNYVEFTPKRNCEDSNVSDPFDFWTNPKPHSATYVIGK